MKKNYKKFFFFFILISTVISFSYLFFLEPAPISGSAGNCKFGYNTWPGNPCRYEVASNCVDCSYAR